MKKAKRRQLADQQAEVEEEKPDLPPIGILILLSVIFPGAGQLANNEKSKGVAFIGVSVVIALFFFSQLAWMTAPLFDAANHGRMPVMDDAFFAHIKRLLYILGAALLVWIVALVDCVVVGWRNLHPPQG